MPRKIPKDIDKRVKEIIRRTEILGATPENWIEATTNITARRYIVNLLTDEGVTHFEIATILGVSPKTVWNDISATQMESLRGLPKDWVMSQVISDRKRLTMLAQKNYSDAERAETPQIKGMFRRLAAEATTQAANILVKIISPDILINLLKPPEESTDRLSKLQSAYVKRMMTVNKDEIEAATLISGPNGDVKK